MFTLEKTDISQKLLKVDVDVKVHAVPHIRNRYILKERDLIVLLTQIEYLDLVCTIF